jgi:hypothetical protein
VKENFRTISNRWELSIFTTIPPYTNKKIINIFERFFKNENISFFILKNSFNLNENIYTYIKFEKQINNTRHF